MQFPQKTFQVQSLQATGAADAPRVRVILFGADDQALPASGVYLAFDVTKDVFDAAPLTLGQTITGSFA